MHDVWRINLAATKANLEIIEPQVDERPHGWKHVNTYRQKDRRQYGHQSNQRRVSLLFA
jgi:hypothetical protein